MGEVWRDQLSLLYPHWTTLHPSYRTYLLSSLCAQLGAALAELRVVILACSPLSEH